MNYESYIRLFETAVKENWNSPAISDYRKLDLSYGQLAENIEKMRLVWEKAGVMPGDKIALNAKSSSNWASIFMGSTANGYVAVQLFNGFTPSDTQNLVNHSESKILYTEKRIFDNMSFEDMPMLLAAIDCNTGELLASRGDFEQIFNSADELLSQKYPQGYSASDVSFADADMESICAIMYTSGSTGNPKGVMLKIRNFSANVAAFYETVPYRRGETYLSILPFAHIFGLTVDVVVPLCTGVHVTVLGMLPAPALLKDALMDVRPHILFAVPLIFIKFIDHVIGTYINSDEGRSRLADAENNPLYCKMLSDVLLSSMGGNIELFATGGAAIPSELETLMVSYLKVPFITGYGMSECAPLISIGDKSSYKRKSCGEYIHNYLDLKVVSPDPANIAGEVLVKGDVVFAGYYKNPDATAEAFTEDGWFKTGDMGTVDADRSLFLVGRCKNMLLSTNGQNVYPEEIEVVLNPMPYVAESLIVQRDTRFVALIVVNIDAVSAANLSAEALESVMNQNIAKVNSQIPQYSQISSFELLYEPFKKTPKGSIRRFFYK